MIVYFYLTLFIKLYTLSMYQTYAVDPDRELTYIGTIFAIFTSSNDDFSREDGIRTCISWGGSLTTIISPQEDNRVFSLTTDTHYQCWIGLEYTGDKNVNLTRDAQGYSWLDGSDSLYRKFSSGTSSFSDPLIKFRPNNGRTLEEGWGGAKANENSNCVLCGKLDNSRGCGFTKDNYCYRSYQVDTAINWYGAQSRCENWGGNLTSITSEEENLLIFQRTPINALNCWIGMYSDINGNLTWNDGRNFSYSKWNVKPIDSPPLCVEWNDQGSDVWVTRECNTRTFNCFICKKFAKISFFPPEREIIHNGSIFTYYTTTDKLGAYRSTAQYHFCIGTGGNLVTIDSSGLDQILYDLAVSDDVNCWIGLEKVNRGNEEIIWIDGSTSTYRNYQEQTPNNGHRYFALRAKDGNRTSGWENTGDTILYCAICQRPVNIRECQFTNDGFCYRTFQSVFPTINWFHAQLSCQMWGGNLASITSEEENTLLYLRTPTSALNCWIGLTDNGIADGTYHWIDGEVSSYDMWASGAPNNIPDTDDCTRIKVGGMNEWNNYNCSSLTDSYICKRNSSAQFDPALGEVFGELINQNLGFRELDINIILYRNVTLICGDVTNPNSSSTNWIYSQNNDLSINTTVSPNNLYLQPGIISIFISNSQQGFYQCRIQKQDGATSVYTVGIFDRSVTIVAEPGRTYNYTVGIDREEIVLLCDFMNTSINPINYRWKYTGAISYITNPLNFSNFGSTDLTLICEVSNFPMLSVSLTIREPILTITYIPASLHTQTLIYPRTNQFSVEGLKQDLTITCNIEGRWKLPDGTYQTGSTITYPYLLQQYTGLHMFYLYNWDGIEVPAIQTNITATDNIGIFTSTVSGTERWEILQNNSRVFLTEQPTTILCVGPRITSSVEWFREDTLLRRSDGSNILDEGSIQTHGYYNCRVDEVSTYSIYVANKSQLVEITDFTEALNYTLGSPTLLYHSNNSVPNSQILWETEDIETGDDRIFNPEYPNPVPLSTIFTDVGGGQHTFTCFYRNSPVTVLGSVMFNMKDTTNVTISYNTTEETFNDINNPAFPTPQKVEIPEGTVNISLKCSLSECIWKIKYNQSKMDITVNTPSLNIINFSTEDEGTYSLHKVTESGINYTTADIVIRILPIRNTESNPPSTSNNVAAVAISVIVAVILTFFIIFLIIVLIICLVKKCKSNSLIVPKKMQSNPNINRQYTNITSRFTSSKAKTKTVGPSYANLSDLTELKEYSKTDGKKKSSDANYMTIDESTLIPLEGEEKTDPYYSDLGKLDAQKDIFKRTSIPQAVIQETMPECSEEMGRIATSPYYTVMSPLTDTKTIVTPIIPAKEYSQTYEKYVESGIAEGSIFFSEFQELKLECEDLFRMAVSEGTKPENAKKNPFKNAYPYDENRVVLSSPNYECSYINASWLDLHQFVATIHPTQDTLRDFFQLICQTEASMVVMLTTRKEKAKILGGISKRVCYWPRNKDEHFRCEQFSCKLRSTTETSAFIKNEILVQDALENKEHSFIQCISPIWNEDSTLVDFNYAVSLLTRIIKQKQDMPSKPIIIHCKDGIAKTGVLMTVHNVIKEICASKTISVFNNVKKLRRQRMNMVPALACYTTCYTLLNEYCSVHV